METIEWIISVILFIIIETVAILLVREFVMSKNGMLRKLMIWYFAIEIWVYIVFFYYFGNAIEVIGFFLLASLPKAIIKIIIFFYLRDINKKTIIP